MFGAFYSVSTLEFKGEYPDIYGVYDFEYEFLGEYTIIPVHRILYVMVAAFLKFGKLFQRMGVISERDIFRVEIDNLITEISVENALELMCRAAINVGVYDPYSIADWMPRCCCECRLYEFYYRDATGYDFGDLCDELDDLFFMTDSTIHHDGTAHSLGHDITAEDLYFRMEEEVGMSQSGVEYEPLSDEQLAPSRKYFKYVHPCSGGRKPGGRVEWSRSSTLPNDRFKAQHKELDYIYGIVPCIPHVDKDDEERCRKLFSKLCTGEFSMQMLSLSFINFNKLLFELGWQHSHRFMDYDKAYTLLKPVLRGYQLSHWKSRQLNTKRTKNKSLRLFVKNYNFFLRIFSKVRKNTFGKYVSFLLSSKKEKISVKFEQTRKEQARIIEMEMVGKSQGFGEWWTKTFTDPVANATGGFVGKVAQNAFSNAMSGLLSEIPSKIKGLFKNLKGSLINMLKAVKEAFFNLYKWCSVQVKTILESLSELSKNLDMKVVFAWSILFFSVIACIMKKDLTPVLFSLIGLALCECARRVGFNPSSDVLDTMIQSSKEDGVGSSQAGNYILGHSFAIAVAVLGASNTAFNLADKVPRVFTNIKDGIYYYMDKIYFMISGKHCFLSKTEVDDLTEYFKELTELFNDETLYSTFLKDDVKRKKIIRLGKQLRRFETLLMRVDRHPQFSFWMSRFDKLKNMHQQVLATTGTHDNRIETAMLWLHGKPGQGKSSVLPKIFRAVYGIVKRRFPDMFPEEWSDAQVFTRAKGSIHWDTYQQQFITLFNEVGAQSDSSERAREMLEIMSACDTAVYSLFMAALDMKGISLFNSYMLAATTNLTDAQLKTECGLTDPTALIRRKTVSAEVIRGETLKDDYSNINEAWIFEIDYEQNMDEHIKKGYHPEMYERCKAARKMDNLSEWKDDKKSQGKLRLNFSEVVFYMADTISNRIIKKHSTAKADSEFDWCSLIDRTLPGRSLTSVKTEVKKVVEEKKEKVQVKESKTQKWLKEARESLLNGEDMKYVADLLNKISSREGESQGFEDEVIIPKKDQIREHLSYEARVVIARTAYQAFLNGQYKEEILLIGEQPTMDKYEYLMTLADLARVTHIPTTTNVVNLNDVRSSSSSDSTKIIEEEEEIVEEPVPNHIHGQVTVGDMVDKIDKHTVTWKQWFKEKLCAPVGLSKWLAGVKEDFEYWDTVFREDFKLPTTDVEETMSCIKNFSSQELDTLYWHIEHKIYAPGKYHTKFKLECWDLNAKFWYTLWRGLMNPIWHERREAYRFMKFVVLGFRMIERQLIQGYDFNSGVIEALIKEIENHVWCKKHEKFYVESFIDAWKQDDPNLMQCVKKFEHPLLKVFATCLFGDYEETNILHLKMQKVSTDREYAWGMDLTYFATVSNPMVAYTVKDAYKMLNPYRPLLHRKGEKLKMMAVKMKHNIESFYDYFRYMDPFYFQVFRGVVYACAAILGFTFGRMLVGAGLYWYDMGVKEVETEPVGKEENEFDIIPTQYNSSQSHTRKNTPQMQKLRSVNPHVGASQNSEQESVFVNSCNSISNNMRDFHLFYKDGSSHSCKILMSGHKGWIPAHIIGAWGTGIREVAISNGEALIHRFSADRISMEENKGRDTYTIHFPKSVQPYPSLRSFLMSEEDLDEMVSNEYYQVYRLHKKRTKDGSVLYTHPGARVEMHESALFDFKHGSGKVRTKVHGCFSLIGGFGEAGDCMSPYIAKDPRSGQVKILGLHIGRIGNDSYFTPLTMNDIGVSQGEAEGVFVPSCVRDLQPADHTQYEGRLVSIGKAKKTVFIPSETVFEPSVFGLNAPNGEPFEGEIRVAPAVLRPCVYKDKETGEIKDLQPLKQGMAKMVSSPIRSFPEWIIEWCIKNPNEAFVGFFPHKRKIFRLFTIQEAIFGILGYFDGLDSSTSVGYDMQVLGFKSRKDVWNKDTKWIHPDLIAAVMEIFDACKKGLIPKNVVAACLKDELRDLDRVKAGKTRIFCVGSLAHLIFTVMVMGDMVCYMKAHRSTTDVAIGINPHGQEWSFLYKKITSLPDALYGGGDFSGFDTSIVSEIAFCMSQGFQWYAANATKEYKWLIHCACMSSLGAYIVVGDTVYDMDWMNSSGGWLTGVLNSFANCLIFNSYWTLMSACHPEVFEGKIMDEHMRRAFYGDDNLWSVTPDVSQYINMRLIAQYIWEVFGMKYTTPSKDEVTTEFLELNDLEFLCRKFVIRNGIVYAPLDSDSIVGMLHWIRRPSAKTGLSLKTQLEQNIEVASMEYFHYGEKTYNVMTEKLRTMCDKTYHSFTGLPFKSYQERFNQTFG